MQGSLLGAFIAGIFMANFMGREAVSNAGILNDYFVEKFQYTEVNGQNLFFYIMGERVPLLLLLLLLTLTSLGLVGGLFMLGWQGFSVGFMLSTAIAKYGLKGILLVLGGLFPQYLFYFPVYILYCYLADYLRRRIGIPVPTKSHKSWLTKKLFTISVLLTGVVILYFAHFVALSFLILAIELREKPIITRSA